MAFRDENEALRQRVRALEEEVETLTEELVEARTAPKVRVEPERKRKTKKPNPAVPARTLEDEIAKKEAAKEAARKRADAKRQARADKLAALPQEVRVSKTKNETTIEINRSLGEELSRGLPLTATLALMAIPVSGGLFETFGLSPLPFIVLAIASISVVRALFMRPRHTLRLVGKNFELRRGSRTVMMGRRNDLRIRLYREDAPAELGEVSFKHETREVEITGIPPKDMQLLKPFEK